MGWRCAECGEPHEGDNPPCTACGYHSFVPESDGDGVRRSFVWTCPECGREHQKNSPPCNRCGNVHLEQRRPDYSDVEEPDGASWFEALDPKYAVGYAAVVGFAILVALSLTGVVSVPWLFGPTPPGAPGDADSYGNVSLQAVEDAYVDALNERRSGLAAGGLSVGSRLDDAATAHNQRQVQAAAGEGRSESLGTILDRYEPGCSGDIVYDDGVVPADAVFGGDEDTDADAIAGNLPIQPSGAGSSLLAARHSTVGVDVHVGPSDTVFATVVVC